MEDSKSNPPRTTGPLSAGSSKHPTYAEKEAEIAKLYEKIDSDKKKSLRKMQLYAVKNEAFQRHRQQTLDSIEMITRSRQEQSEGQSSVPSSQCSFVIECPNPEQFEAELLAVMEQRELLLKG